MLINDEKLNSNYSKYQRKRRWPIYSKADDIQFQ